MSGNTSLTIEDDNDLTDLENVLVTETSTGEAIDHTNIDEEVKERVVNDVKKYLLSLETE